MDFSCYINFFGQRERARAGAGLCTTGSSCINLIVPRSLFSPGDVGDCTKHW